MLYPMNALATDQARRLAAAAHRAAGARLASRPALYIGEAGARRTTVTEDGLITRPGRHPRRPRRTSCSPTTRCSTSCCCAARTGRCGPERATSLRYLVLDEFHTYDGAQGTDVAMLLRRLGRRSASPRTSGRSAAIAPVATSATLGGGSDGGRRAARVRRKVFGAEFDEASLIGEDRLTVEEWAMVRPAASRCSTGSPRRCAAARHTTRSCAKVRASSGPTRRGRPRSAGAGGVAARAPVHPTACFSSRLSPCR